MFVMTSSSEKPAWTVIGEPTRNVVPVTVPLKVFVNASVGGVLATTLKVTGAEVTTAPVLSVALAVRVWGPSGVVPGTMTVPPKGKLVSFATKTPSSSNATFVIAPVVVVVTVKSAYTATFWPAVGLVMAMVVGSIVVDTPEMARLSTVLPSSGLGSELSSAQRM